MSISEYLVQAIKDGEVRYSKIASILSNTAGVADYKNLIVNGNNTNVQLMSNQIPTISETTIKFDETKTNIENIKEAIADAGFKGE